MEEKRPTTNPTGLERRREMPRGVYDRTKTKEQRAAEKSGVVVKGPKATKKAAPTKTAAKAAVVQKAAPVKHVSTAPKVHTSDLDVGTKFAIVRENISTLVGAVQGLTGGSQVVVQHPVAPLVEQLDGELEANIHVLGRLRREVFGLTEAEITAATEKAAAELEAEAEAAAAEEIEEQPQVAPQVAVPAQSVPAQPYPAQPQGMVPMPPAVPPGFPQ